MLGNSVGWTEERIGVLKSRFARGLSAREIAREIGVSRNAVIGKISRLKLNTANGGCSAGSSAPKLQRRPTQNKILRALRAEVHPGGEEIPVHDGQRCSLLELTEQHCRWPIGSATDVHFWFCGNKRVEGLPYCPGHARMAYQSKG
jgi:GcrA cell cycle regulator